MSKIGILGKKFEGLASLIDDYDQHLNVVEHRLSLRGKTIEEANKEQAVWPIFYDERRAELETLCKHLETQVEKIRGALFRKIKESNARDTSDRAVDKYVDAQDEFIQANEVYLELFELFEKYKAVVDAFKTRGFALRNIVESRIHKIEQSLL